MGISINNPPNEIVLADYVYIDEFGGSYTDSRIKSTDIVLIGCADIGGSYPYLVTVSDVSDGSITFLTGSVLLAQGSTRYMLIVVRKK